MMSRLSNNDLINTTATCGQDVVNDLSTVIWVYTQSPFLPPPRYSHPSFLAVDTIFCYYNSTR